MEQQLGVLNFGELDIQLFGDLEDPLVKCSDLIIHVLGYRDVNQANWFKFMKNDNYYVTTVNHRAQEKMLCFTEQGVYKALMKSNRSIAEQFQKKVCQFLKNKRKQALFELEQTKQKLNQLQQQKRASLYKILVDNEIVYIGQDTSKSQTRPQQHFHKRYQIATQYQMIDSYLATIPIQNIEIQIQQCTDEKVDELEQEMIQKHKPRFNQQHNDHNTYICQFCLKSYKNRASFEKHLVQKHQ